MRILIFAHNLATARSVAEGLGWPYASHAYGKHPGDVNPVVQAFLDDPNGKLVATRALTHGWRAPTDTTVLFTAGFPDGPERAWAAARPRVQTLDLQPVEG
jgi:hypothetical protein